MDTKKIKEGISVKEIEGFAKKYRFELFFCLSLILSWVFSFVFFDGWSLLCATIGGLLGMIFSQKVDQLFKKMVVFVRKQEDLTQLILGGAGLILSIFLPFIIYFILGSAAGIMLKQMVPAIVETK